MRLVGIAELTVYFVRKKEEIMLACDFSEGQHAFLRILCTGWVSRVAYQDCLCLLGDCLFEFFNVRNLETVSDVSLNSLECKAVHKCECVVVGIERLKYNHFVSRIAGNLKSEVHTLASCYGYNQFVNCDVNADLLVVLLNKTFA